MSDIDTDREPELEDTRDERLSYEEWLEEQAAERADYEYDRECDR